MREANEDFIVKTLEVWQTKILSDLTREDARQIIDNVTGFFGVLQEWEAAEKRHSKNTGIDSVKIVG